LMNINAKITNESFSSFPARLVPLYALLTNGLGNYPGYSEETAANNIYDVVYDSGNDLHTVFPSFPNGMFCFDGQVCEMKGLSKNTAGGKSLAETPARGIVNIITPRSDVFTIWAIAQSIKDVNRNGTYDPGIDVITGVAKVQAIVQRYEDPPLSGNMKFRTLYYRFVQ